MTDRPGISTAMIGIVVLISLAVVLSLVMEKRAAFAKNKIAIKQSISANGEILDSLRGSLEDLRAKWDSQRYRSKDHGRLIAEIRASQTLKSGRLRELAARKSELREGIGALDMAYGRYRSDYRKAVWSGAIGEKWASLKASGGREYLDVVISKVTEVGLEIRHQDGLARIQARDLGSEWQDRFQWTSLRDSLGRN